jgi:hypothetical protein
MARNVEVHYGIVLFPGFVMVVMVQGVGGVYMQKGCSEKPQ